jgi:dienelactone hydrolase
MRTAILVVTVAMCVAPARPAAAAVKSREVQIKQGGETLQGFVAWDDASSKRQPAVVIVHGGWGYQEHVRKQAERLAASGYVGFAFDMFATGKVVSHLEHSGGVMRELDRNPALVKARFDAALALIKNDPHVDPDKISAMGYCWGGTVVLNMARAGTDLDAVVVFHGGLTTEAPARRGQVKARILVLNGGADPIVPVAQVEPFKKEMTEANVRFDVVLYPGVKHSYENPYADHAGSDAMAYNADADRQSWAAMLGLLSEVYQSR